MVLLGRLLHAHTEFRRCSSGARAGCEDLVILTSTNLLSCELDVVCLDHQYGVPVIQRVVAFKHATRTPAGVDAVELAQVVIEVTNRRYARSVDFRVSLGELSRDCKGLVDALQVALDLINEVVDIPLLVSLLWE